MTYATSMGAYYADTPGFDLPNEAAAGYGSFGSVSLSSSELRADLNTWVAYQNALEASKSSGPVPDASQAAAANAASRRLANRIRAALAQLGFGPDVKMDTYWGSGTDCAAYELFLSTMGVGRTPGPCGGVSGAQLDVLSELVAQQNATGATPGPLKVVEYHEISPGVFALGPAPGQKPLATSKSMAGFGILAFILLGVGTYLIFRKKPLVHYKQTTTTYKSNRRHRSRRSH